MVPLAIESLSVRAFRNLSRVDLELGPRFNVLSGDNGQGKTNLLESVYVLATSRSFRTAKLAELVEAGSETASVRGVLREADTEREQTVGVRAGMRAARVDGKRPATLADYAVRTPTVVFHPGVVALSAGSGADRRKLLDRVALYLQPGSLAESGAYVRALRARQRVLESRGVDAADLDDWEALVVRHGTAMRAARHDAAARLGPAAERAFASIGPSGLALRVSYAPNVAGDAEELRRLLATNRARDRARGAATSGPHRDELALELGGRPMRGMASQGQHRAAVLALELAEIEVVGEARGVRPLLLLDDVSSELDRARTAALFAALSSQRGQVLLTTTRPELIETGALSSVEERKDFRVVGGHVEPA
ncbi:MAG TPA: DNA replication and repair protein RecF [Polyangiaceae bacterium]|jgi:DNA replication and repair protein RecF|nr:DNA replication and repair protein RecF [Polyangiaceae bacterium]